MIRFHFLTLKGRAGFSSIVLKFIPENYHLLSKRETENKIIVLEYLIKKISL